MDTAVKEDLMAKVKSALDKVRPYLIADGGNVSLENITDDYKVEVKLMGACHGCPHSVQTLKAGIERAVIQEVPEIKEVVAI